jgi:hypothetical protein
MVVDTVISATAGNPFQKYPELYWLKQWSSSCPALNSNPSAALSQKEMSKTIYEAVFGVK